MPDEKHEQENDLRRKASRRLGGKPGPEPDELTHGEAVKLVHELRVHQEELEIQKEELEASREDLAVARDRYRDLYDFAPVGYLALAGHNVIKEANITACRMLGIRREDVLGRRFSRFIDRVSQDEFYRRRHEIEKSATGQSFELLMRREDGGSFWALVEAVPREARVRLTLTDITARKEAEWQLRLKDAAVAAATAGIAFTDLEGTITYVNAAMLRMWGYETPEELLGKDCQLTVTQSGWPPEGFQTVLREGSWQGELEGIRKDGSRFDVEVAANTVPGPGEEPINVMASFLDITERKKAERMKDEFLSLVSHELRTPMTVIKGSLEVALGGGIAPVDTLGLLRNAIESAKALDDIMENMLELTRHQAGRLALNRVPVDPRDLVNKVIAALKTVGARQKFTVRIGDEVPRVPLDPLRIEHVLHNLMENAVKYSPPESEITVACHVNEGQLITEIHDEGSGISIADQKKLFQLFSRVGVTEGIPGTGLGLVVCKRLVEAHGGWIHVASEPGKGATFSFGLPLSSGN